jgi:molybdopterin-containing oxidoreductase family iron-sulfur binding subunit
MGNAISSKLLDVPSMKKPSSIPSNSNVSGRAYWRGLDELADTPEFQQWVAREFPSGASEFFDPVSRRNFMRVMSASFMLAGLGLTGCRRPVENIYPFAKQPDDYVHGVPQFYATAMPSRRAALPLVVKSNDGRPTKIEGNPDHPDSKGASDPFAQASVLQLYDPDRATRSRENGETRTRQQVLDALAALGKSAGDGSGLAFLAEQSSSPSRARLQQAIAEKFPRASWHVFEPIELDLDRQAASLAFGKSARPVYNLDKAERILAIDCDFIGSEENAVSNIRKFADGRYLEGKESSMSRLYAVESLFTLTGMNADHRLRVPPGMIVPVLARLASAILGGGELDQKLKELGAPAQAHDKWIAPCAKDLLANKGKSLVMAGHRLPLAAHLLVLAINDALGAMGATMELREVQMSKEASIAELATALNAGQVQTLVILGGNPAYDAPSDLNWRQAQAKAKTVVRLGYYDDETSWNASAHPAQQWDLARAHYLESWGDARTADGTVVPVQPLINPLFGGITDLEVLAILAGSKSSSPYDVVRETFQTLSGNGGEDGWRKFLHDGFLPNTASAAVTGSYNGAETSKALNELKAPAAPAGRQNFDVVFYRDAKMDDGRYNNVGWLQELPDPITKLTWDNAVLMSPATAKELGVYDERDAQNQKFFNRKVKVTLNNRSITAPVWVQPGMADYTVGLALGYGREKTGRVGIGTGFDAYPLRTSTALYYASGAQVADTGDASYELATTQSHWDMAGRPAVREAYLDEFRKKPDFAKEMEGEEPPVVAPMYPNPLDARKSHGLHQWGMSIDLNRCVGCSACMVACQSENNIPIVGKEMVGKSREMHWIRIDRYYAGPVEDPQAVTQPMLCQHCESAPCENVCPVNATSHDDEGLNLMTYNRCVGTRYCSNNCPYKVRRFNFFDYNRRPLNQLYKSPLVMETDGKYELLRWLENPDKGSLPEDQWQLAKLVKNPDVTVRMRGVMEKCSFCLQRIEQAKIAQKVKARDTDHIRLSEKEGTVPQTACQQACPAEAIVFGDTSDPESRVSKLKHAERDYSVLSILLTKPRVTYMAKVRNFNAEMPGPKQPYTDQAISETIGIPLQGAGESSEKSEKGAR